MQYPQSAPRALVMFIGGVCCRNAGAMAAERAQVHREYMLRKQEALRNRARGRGGVMSPYVSCICE